MRLNIRLIALIVLLASLLPFTAQAQPAPGWRVYSEAHGFSAPHASQVAPDIRLGFWVGHIFRAGWPAHPTISPVEYLSPEGELRRYGDPASACPSVHELEVGRDNIAWVRFRGLSQAIQDDATGSCEAAYGAGLGLGYILHETLYMLPSQALPAGMVKYGLAVDALSRPWVGTEAGVAMRELDGSWHGMTLWDTGDSTLHVRAVDGGTRLVATSLKGGVSLLSTDPASTPQRLRQPNDKWILDIVQVPSGFVILTDDELLIYEGGQWHHFAGRPTGEITAYSLAYIAERIWLAGGPGLWFYDSTSWHKVNAGETPLPNDEIYEIVGKDGMLWAATGNGVARYGWPITGDDPSFSESRRAFDSLWSRTDGMSRGSWVWGPSSWAERHEPYAEGLGGSRRVRYYDKTRMELTRPGSDSSSLWYVTNGLLVMEMVQGRRQAGDDFTRGFCPVNHLWEHGALPCPAQVPVAGNWQNNDFTPYYADFAGRLGRSPAQIDARVGATLTRPQIHQPLVEGYRAELASEATSIVAYDELTGHNIPAVLWNYMRKQPVDQLYMFGRPISEAYWTRTIVGDQEKWVLVQLFERRTLTYTPDNAPEWQVEMGNVGQHYYFWRYQPFTPPWA